MAQIEKKPQGWLSLGLGGGGSVLLAALIYLSYRLAELDYPSYSLQQILASAGLIVVLAVLLAGFVLGIMAYLSRPRIRLWAFLGMSFSGISLLIFIGLFILSLIYPDL